MEIETDIAIIGAGPTGLYGAYCAGFRGLRTVLVDALPQVGGQISALYPEKEIRDVAGIPGVPGRSLVAALSAQAAAYDPVHLLGRQAVELRRDADPRPVVVLLDGTAVRAGAVVLTSGIGTFTPRPLPAGEEWLGRGLTYFVPDPSAHAGHDVVVVGGGDSAVDWSLALAPLARSVTLVHRRAAFRAHAGGVAAARAAGVRIVVDSQVVGLSGAERVERAHLRTRGEADRAVPADSVIAALGFISDLGPLAGWGLSLRGRSVLVDQRMRTACPACTRPATSPSTTARSA